MTECYAYARLRRESPPACALACTAAPLPWASLTLAHGACAPGAPPRLLPAWESCSGGARGRQLAWDGRRVRLVDPQSFSIGAAGSPGKRQSALSPAALGRALGRARARTIAAFLPDQISVTDDYWAYARWRFVQRVAAQALTVLATQQLLRAVGLGASRTLPAAAALNWVLKDGLGRLGKLSVATHFGRTFDSDVKRSRFTSSCVYDLAALIEMCTPLAPSHFLLLATVATVCKSVGVTTSVAVRAPLQKSFALEENLADIAARTQAQQVLADSGGLALAVALGAGARRLGLAQGPAGPLLFFPPLAALDLWAIRRQLKAVLLRTLNKERAEIIAEQWLATGRVPCHAQVAAAERLLVPARIDASSLPLTIGALTQAAEHADDVLALLMQPSAKREGYVLAYRPAPPKWSPPWLRKRRGGTAGLRGCARLALQAGATSGDIVQALLQVAHLRRLPYRGDLPACEARRWALQESYQRARRDRRAFLRALKEQHWQTEHVLLSSAERAPYKL